MYVAKQIATINKFWRVAKTTLQKLIATNMITILIM